MNSRAFFPARVVAGILFLGALGPPESIAQRAALTPDFGVDASTRAEVIEQALKDLKESYVFPEVAVAMATAIDERRRSGAYEKLETAAAFAAQLTADLQAVSRDKHLRVTHSERKGNATSREGNERSASSGEVSPHGFARIERLPGNIGYIDLRAFSSVAAAGAKAAAAMQELAKTDALLLDLRRNGGGSAEMVALLASYLLEGKPQLLNSFVGRSGMVVSETWTLKDLPAPRYATEKEVYLLTSSYTFSAAEELRTIWQTLSARPWSAKSRAEAQTRSTFFASPTASP